MKNMLQCLMLGFLVSLATACNNHHASYCGPGERDFTNAAYWGDVEEMKRLHGIGVDINANCKKAFYDPALVNAASTGHLEAVKWLIENEANVNEKVKGDSYSGATALLKAAAWGHKKIVSELISAGALINLADSEGMTPLMHAAWEGYPEVVEELIRRKANVNQKDNKNHTVLWYAKNRRKSKTRKARKDIVRMLKQAGAKEDYSRRFLEYVPRIIRTMGKNISCLLSL